MCPISKEVKRATRELYNIAKNAPKLTLFHEICQKKTPSQIERQNGYLRVCGQIARVVEGNERNCWRDQIHQVGLTIKNTIGKFSGDGLGND